MFMRSSGTRRTHFYVSYTCLLVIGMNLEEGGKDEEVLFFYCP